MIGVLCSQPPCSDRRSESLSILRGKSVSIAIRFWHAPDFKNLYQALAHGRQLRKALILDSCPRGSNLKRAELAPTMLGTDARNAPSLHLKCWLASFIGRRTKGLAPRGNPCGEIFDADPKALCSRDDSENAEGSRHCFGN